MASEGISTTSEADSVLSKWEKVKGEIFVALEKGIAVYQKDVVDVYVGTTPTVKKLLLNPTEESILNTVEYVHPTLRALKEKNIPGSEWLSDSMEEHGVNVLCGPLLQYFIATKPLFREAANVIAYGEEEKEDSGTPSTVSAFRSRSPSLGPKTEGSAVIEDAEDLPAIDEMQEMARMAGVSPEVLERSMRRARDLAEKRSLISPQVSVNDLPENANGSFSQEKKESAGGWLTFAGPEDGKTQEVPSLDLSTDKKNDETKNEFSDAVEAASREKEGEVQTGGVPLEEFIEAPPGHNQNITFGGHFEAISVEKTSEVSTSGNPPQQSPPEPQITLVSNPSFNFGRVPTAEENASTPKLKQDKEIVPEENELPAVQVSTPVIAQEPVKEEKRAEIKVKGEKPVEKTQPVAVKNSRGFFACCFTPQVVN